MAPSGSTATAWVLEEALSARRQHIAAGDEIEAGVVALRADRCPSVLGPLRLPRPRWQLHPGAAGAAGPRLLRGRVGSVRAITAAHRLDEPDVWVPDPLTVRMREVASTCEVDPARSVWIPSRQPVLLGFLLTVEDVSVDAPAATPAAPRRAARPGDRRTPAPA